MSRVKCYLCCLGYCVSGGSLQFRLVLHIFDVLPFFCPSCQQKRQLRQHLPVFAWQLCQSSCPYIQCLSHPKTNPGVSAGAAKSVKAERKRVNGNKALPAVAVVDKGMLPAEEEAVLKDVDMTALHR